MTYNPAIYHRRSIRLKDHDYAQTGAYFITLCTHNRQSFFGNIVRSGLAPAQMKFNEYGQIAHDQWLQIPTRFDHIELGAFVIMPNHFHGIIIIHDQARDHQPAQPQFGRSQFGQPQGLPLQNINGTDHPIDGVGAGFTPAQDVDHPIDRIGASPTLTEITNGQTHSGRPQGLPLQAAQRITVGNIVGAYKSRVANECLKIFKSKNQTLGKLWQRNYYEHIIRDEKSHIKLAQYILDNPAQWELDSLYPGGK